jgi:hypothetical protein
VPARQCKVCFTVKISFLGDSFLNLRGRLRGAVFTAGKRFVGGLWFFAVHIVLDSFVSGYKYKSIFFVCWLAVFSNDPAVAPFCFRQDIK